MNRFALPLTVLISLFISSANLWAICVKAPKANLREGPGTSYQKTWQVYKYMPFKILEKHGMWYKIGDVDGDHHWIHKNLVTPSVNCATVKVNKVNLRTGPGLKYKKVPNLPLGEKYMSFKVLEIKDGWAKVKHELGDVAWVHRKLIWVQ